ncbi:type VI secretion system protein TssA [Geobacter hydrogenophilus]|uniref:Type VI secretion system protein n=1 Tax=Geobacter hydrogenophilus TaxID=40983 RepID=A0A9W6G0K1_9BACT|nr:type VI secretion system protein TssA [Geobacter hydrogenophilus]MBT0895460.1 type VI secretion system protein TssA [Geobacter hydrogenophilus]GLI38316.1 type VI secretion system protein [Geobacter hydrogenophilus]
MLGTDTTTTWHWSAFGKHPAAADYFRLGHSSPFVDGLTKWVESGYTLQSERSAAPPPFCSWRFWARGFGRESLVLGVVRVSSDSLGRPYPLLIMGSGPLEGWEGQWDLLPFACEKSWCQIEFLATNTFGDLKKLEEGLQGLRPPTSDWDELAERRRGLNRLGSPRDPYASFLDSPRLETVAAERAGKDEFSVRLDRGPVNDKITLVSLWHLLAKGAAKGVPNALFMGGTLERSFLASYRRALAPGDFLHLWSASDAGGWPNSIGTEYAMDIATLGKEPVRPDQPVGEDVRYDPLFDTLQAEVDKLTSPAIAGTVDWEKVVRLSVDILATRSKDLLVASYLAVGLVQTRGGDGLALGLKVWRDLLERFWSDLYPTRMRGRQRSVEWWLDRTEIALRQQRPQTLPTEQHGIVLETLAAIDRFLGEHLEDAPSLTKLRELVSDMAPEEGGETVSEAVAPPPAQPEAPATDLFAPPRQATVPPVEPPRQTIAPGSSLQALEEGLRQVGEAAGALLQQDPAGPVPYRLSRLAAWGKVTELPPAVNGRTRIPPPERQVLTLLQELASHGDGEALLKAAEARLPQFIFWLDLSRLTVEALSRLGDRFAAAREAVCAETAAFVGRLPGLDGLAFADGTPFADPETRQWLAGLAQREASAVHCPAGADSDGRAEAIAREAEEAQALIRSGKLLEAVERFQKQLGNGASRKEKLLWRLALAQLLVNTNRARLALPHLEQVMADIGAFGLEEYDPALALRGLKLAWVGFDSQAEPRFKEKAADALHRIARLDPVEMVRLAKG